MKITQKTLLNKVQKSEIKGIFSRKISEKIDSVIDKKMAIFDKEKNRKLLRDQQILSQTFVTF